MKSNRLKIFIPLRSKYGSKLIKYRALRYIESLLDVFNATIVDDINEEIDIAHIYNIHDALDYLPIFDAKNIPYIFHAFIFGDEFEYDEKENKITLKRESIKIYNKASTVIVFSSSQEKLLKEIGVTSNIEILSPIGTDYNAKDELTKSAFLDSYGLNKNTRYVLAIENYAHKTNFENMIAVARIMPDIEFYLFDLKGKGRNLITRVDEEECSDNVHYRTDLSISLLPSLISNALALVIPDFTHIDSLFLSDFMKTNIPIIAQNNMAIEDILKDKSVLMSNCTVDELYRNIHDIENNNKIKEANRYINSFSTREEANKLEQIYLKLI